MLLHWLNVKDNIKYDPAAYSEDSSLKVCFILIALTLHGCNYGTPTQPNLNFKKQQNLVTK